VVDGIENSGFAGVDWFAAIVEPPAWGVEAALAPPNSELPVLAKSPAAGVAEVVAGVVLAGACDALWAPNREGVAGLLAVFPNKLPVLPAAGAAPPPKSPGVAGFALAEKMLGAPAVVAAGVVDAAPPNRLGPAPGVVAAGVEVPDAPKRPAPGAAGAGDAVLAPKRPPGFGVLAAEPPNSDPPAAVGAVLGRPPKENLGVPVAWPKSPPVAGADVAGVLPDCAPEVGVELGAPKLKDMLFTGRVGEPDVARSGRKC